MCGRMAITLPQDAMTQLFAATPDNDLPTDPNWNVCPTATIAVCTSSSGQRRLRPMRWGFVPSWYQTPTDGPLLINARSETIAEKPAFRDACRQRRCLIVADGFYEWKRDKGATPEPWFVTRADGTPMVFGGIWQDWARGDQELTGCAIVTCAANDAMAPIHDRLPVVLEPKDWPLWLGEAGKGGALLMTPTANDTLTFTRVATTVNSNRASGPDLILPLSGRNPAPTS